MADLEFLKPFKASNDTRFDLTRTGKATEVTWTMTGRRSAAMGLAAAKREAERG